MLRVAYVYRLEFLLKWTHIKSYDLRKNAERQISVPELKLEYASLVLYFSQNKSFLSFILYIF